ncbi:hypothetical protein SG34_004885 [Thalassomonas viridans]|uniref:Uncharacterized protein n=1 Tax=Thalassomonas viridans TaxID=137584 RepID=A0AAE9Z427_9GAMM|nr:hypothetical protein [Thalassomonas viridans]WDE06265.1 hypothetical protein SG34_004885 [Thalassomonas viridans]
MTWICQNCNTEVEDDNFAVCWKCSCARGVDNSDREGPSHLFPNAQLFISKPHSVTYKMFRGTFASWDELFTSASEFASTLKPEQLINISHSVNDSDGVVTVWYRK